MLILSVCGYLQVLIQFKPEYATQSTHTHVDRHVASTQPPPTVLDTIRSLNICLHVVLVQWRVSRQMLRPA